MLQPFDHVDISGMEFVLCYKNNGVSMFDSGDEWHAKDELGNSVGLSARSMKKILPQAYHNDVPITKPLFYRERGNNRIPIEIVGMFDEMSEGNVSGTSVDADFTRWEWNLTELTIKNQNETWLLRVFTPGGWWM